MHNDNRHAYLIIAHNNVNLLENLIRLLDHNLNDIYIHIDKKCDEFDFKKIRSIPNLSKVYFINRQDVRWGHYSLVKVELNLIKEALKRNYTYYHLLSGVDLPIKSQSYIHQYFEKNRGKQFIGFDKSNNYENRLRYYHFFNFKEEFKNLSTVNKIKYRFNEISLHYQKVLKINRLKNKNIHIAKGSQWFSITHDFANYIIENEKFIIKMCKYTSCSDEVFLQTIFINSPFYNSMYDYHTDNDNLRLIDWERGTPYTFRSNDLNLIINAEALFARKFCEKVDMEIVNEISKLVKN